MTDSQKYDTTLIRVILTARAEGELSVEVVSIPARKTAKGFSTAHGKRISADSLRRVHVMAENNFVLAYSYVDSESDLEAAISRTSNVARLTTAKRLEDAKACFRAAHGKPTITRKEWAPE